MYMYTCSRTCIHVHVQEPETSITATAVLDMLEVRIIHSPFYNYTVCVYNCTYTCNHVHVYM